MNMIDRQIDRQIDKCLFADNNNVQNKFLQRLLQYDYLLYFKTFIKLLQGWRPFKQPMANLREWPPFFVTF